MEKFVHLLKLSVGSEAVESLAAWQASRGAQSPVGELRHVTRMWPRRESEVLAGGSIYWVIKGLVQVRQRILRLDEVVGQDGIRRCGIVLDPQLVRTTTVPKRPFQGWRYLDPKDAPPDLPTSRLSEDTLPPQLAGALAEIGVL